MRAIEFRGYSEDLSRWVYGGIAFADEDVMIVHIQVGNLMQNTLVIPKSVGQFTGLLDRNGKKVFESDIVTYFNPYSGNDFTQVVRWDDSWACFALFDNMTDQYAKESDWVKISNIEVIGNVFENPNLL